MPGTTLTRRNFLAFDFGDRQRPGDHWVRVHRLAMACRFEVMLSSDDAGDMSGARAALDEADDDRDAADGVPRHQRGVGSQSPRRPREPWPLTPTLFGLLARSAEISRRDRRRLRRDLHAAQPLLGIPAARRPAAVRRRDRAARARSSACSTCAWTRRARTVRFARRGVEVNFGAIGKGFALDRMRAVLRARGVRARADLGRPQQRAAIGGKGRGWPVDLRPRLASRRVGRLWISNGAVGTSGAGEQFIYVDGQRYGHVIDPRSGQSGVGRARRERRSPPTRRRPTRCPPRFSSADRISRGATATRTRTHWPCSCSTSPASAPTCSAATAAQHWRC